MSYEGALYSSENFEVKPLRENGFEKYYNIATLTAADYTFLDIVSNIITEIRNPMPGMLEHGHLLQMWINWEGKIIVMCDMQNGELMFGGWMQGRK